MLLLASIHSTRDNNLIQLEIHLPTDSTDSSQRFSKRSVLDVQLFIPSNKIIKLESEEDKAEGVEQVHHKDTKLDLFSLDLKLALSFVMGNLDSMVEVVVFQDMDHLVHLEPLDSLEEMDWMETQEPMEDREEMESQISIESHVKCVLQLHKDIQDLQDQREELENRDRLDWMETLSMEKTEHRDFLDRQDHQGHQDCRDLWENMDSLPRKKSQVHQDQQE